MPSRARVLEHITYAPRSPSSTLAGSLSKMKATNTNVQDVEQLMTVKDEERFT